MSQENCLNLGKPSFKGIEKFLRRVAHNLGNTPSQTEVKIISCIPIDVTDLQHRIVCLEKELIAARKKIATTDKNDEKLTSTTATVGRALRDSSIVNRCNTVSKCDIKGYDDVKSQELLTRCDCSSEENRSNISYPFNVEQAAEALYESSPSTQSCISKWDRHKRIANKHVRNIFRKRKKKKIKQETSRGKTQIIYYAHTNMHSMDVLSRSYLSDVFRKHYDPRLVLNEFSDTSEYSQPICRDVKYNCNSSPYDSDICSCCHGRFQNLDIYMNDFGINQNTIFTTNHIRNKNNMTNLVDLIPVKEKPVKAKPRLKKEDVKMKPKSYNNVECWPEKVRTKRRYNSPKEFYEIDVPIKNSPEKNTEIKHLRKYVKCNKDIVKLNEQNGIETSNSCSIDCGDIYVKPTQPIKSNLPLYKIKNKDKDTKVLKLAQNVQKTQIKTAINDCTKTEVALNEIKRILQSVLTEVKTSAVTRIVKEEKLKKDAIVQKEASHNYMERSTFLNSFTYNTSNCANPYLVPYSGQIPVAQYCFPNIAYDPINYPIGRVSPHTCTFLHKNDGLQLSETPVITTSTNTDEVPHNTNSKETTKLIKEIYKSVALNMEYPSRENFSGYDELKSTVNDSMISDRKVCADTSVNVSKVMKRDVQVEALLSTTTITTRTGSNLVYTSISSKSRYPRKFKRCDSSDTEDKEKSINPQFTKNKYISEECGFSDTVVSTESNDKIVVQNTENNKDNKKTGRIKNMFQSVFKRKKEINKNEQNVTETASEASDSDDYVTIYSEKAINTPYMQKQKSPGINYIRPPANRIKKTPYMEKENRRQRNEDLIFRKNEYYPPKTMIKSPLYRDPRPYQMYYRDYEARSVFVHPRHLKNYKLTRLNDGNVLNKTGAVKLNNRNKTSWLKKHKLGIRCGKRWKSFILNN